MKRTRSRAAPTPRQLELFEPYLGVGAAPGAPALSPLPPAALAVLAAALLDEARELRCVRADPKGERGRRERLANLRDLCARISPQTRGWFDRALEACEEPPGGCVSFDN